MDNNSKNQELMMRDDDRKAVVDNIAVVVVAKRRRGIDFENRNDNYSDRMKHHLNKRMKEKKSDHHDESRISHVYSSF